MSDITYTQSKRIKFIRTVRRDEMYGTQINTATCTLCGEQLWTQGHTDGVTGIGELNRDVARHREKHYLRGSIL
jgi:hypothetical protein